LWGKCKNNPNFGKGGCGKSGKTPLSTCFLVFQNNSAMHLHTPPSKGCQVAIMGYDEEGLFELAIQV